jgi:hypothetical protein
MSETYPGTRQHQALLARIVSFYRDDPRILAVCLFGSLARGNWDQYSDLDLDVVIEDGLQIDVLAELQNLCAAFRPLNETALIILPDDTDAGDIVLSSFAELSIRYHTLLTTNPNIVDDLRVLIGRIPLEAVKMAGAKNRGASRSVSDHDTDRFLRWAIEVKIRLRRRHFWQALQLLQLMRETLIEIFAVSRGYPRTYHALDKDADETLKAGIGETLPRYSLESIQEVLSSLLNVLENNLEGLSNGQLHLTAAQREVLARIREQ